MSEKAEMETEIAAQKLRNTLNFFFSKLQFAGNTSTSMLDVEQFQELATKISPLLGSVAKMTRKYSSNSNVEEIANYAIISLNGSSKEVLESYINAIVQYRLWNMQRGICIDMSPVLQPDTMFYTTAQNSSFHFIIKYGNDVIDLVFDGKSAWFHGVFKEEWSFQFKGSTYLKDCKHLDFTGTYANIAPGNDAGNIPMGLSNLIKAFKMTHAYKGESSQALREALGTWVLYFGEAPKLHALFRACSISIEDDNIDSLHSVDQNLGVIVRYWGQLCAIGMKYLLKYLHGSEIPALHVPLEEIQKIGLSGINTLQDIIENICIWTYSSPKCKYSNSQIKALSSPSQTLFSPIDVSNDPYEEKVVKHLRQMMYAMSSEKGKEKKKEMNSEEMSDDVEEVLKDTGGHRATFGHRTAKQLVERQGRLFCASSWNSDRHIRANHMGFCLSQKNIKDSPKSVKSSVLTTFLKRRKWFSTFSRFLRP